MSSLEDEAFRSRLAAAIEGHPERISELRDEFAVAPRSVERWAQGYSQPHPILRKEVEEYILKWPL
jgi:hypothetical protein